LQEAWVDLLGELGRERPLLIILEDLHWVRSRCSAS
jgi:predicted ATPase